MNTIEKQINSESYTKVNTGLGPILIEAKKTGIHVALSDTQPEPFVGAFHEVNAGGGIEFSQPGTDTWVIATDQTATSHYVAVTEQANTVEISNRGGVGVAVYLQDQTTGVLDIRFLLLLTTPTLAIDTVVNERTITLSPGHGLVSPTNDGQVIEIASTTDSNIFLQCEIVSIAGDVVTLDCPINHIYTPAGVTVAHSDPNIAVDGSVTPQVFAVAPLPIQSGDITRIIFGMTDNAAMDFETFGGLPTLTNGVVVRVNNGDGTYRNLYNFKSNGDIISQSFDHGFFLNNGGNTRGFNARLTWAGQSKHGVAVRLDGALGEALELVVQDDLTGLLEFGIIAQGSELQGN